MIPVSDIDVNYQVVSVDNNNIVIRPFSNLFTNPISSYPAFSYNLSTFDLTQDLAPQIGSRIQTYIVHTVNNERLTISDSLSALLNNLIDQTITVPQTDINSTVPMIVNTTSPSITAITQLPPFSSAINFVA